MEMQGKSSNLLNVSNKICLLVSCDLLVLLGSYKWNGFRRLSPDELLLFSWMILGVNPCAWSCVL